MNRSHILSIELPISEPRKRMSPDDARALLVAHGLDTRDKALAARAELDARKWGEPEREPSRRLNARRSHALLVNSVAVFDLHAIDVDLMAAAAAIMTDEDRAELRKGG